MLQRRQRNRVQCVVECICKMYFMEITLLKIINKRTLMYIYIIEMCLLTFIQKTFYIKVEIVQSYNCNQKTYEIRQTITNVGSL